MTSLDKAMLGGIFFITSVAASFVMDARRSAQAAPPEINSQAAMVNPNPARILNRTTIKIDGRQYEQVTTENIPGLVCVTTVHMHASIEAMQPAISCVRY